MSARLALGAATALAVPALAAQAQDAAAPPAERGRILYEQVGCAACHGGVGQGGVAGPPLIAPGPYEAFAAQTRAPRGDMPAYSARILSDAELADIYGFLRSLER